jgi:hypothetical protein
MIDYKKYKLSPVLYNCENKTTTTSKLLVIFFQKNTKMFERP